MKHLHKFASVLLALVMALSLMVPAFASSGETTDPTNERKVTITAPAKGSFGVYQIFTGRLEDKDNQKVLSDVKWGQNATNDGETIIVGGAVPQTVLNALAAVNESSDTAQLDVIKNYVNLENQGLGTVKNGSTMQVVPGYYLFKDVTNLLPEGQTPSLHVVKLVGNVTITAKTSNIPTPDKKIKDDTATGWDVKGDFDINQPIDYQLSATLPSNMKDLYKNYRLVFEDTLTNLVLVDNDGNQLTSVTKESLKISAKKSDGTEVTLPAPTITYTSNVLTIDFADVYSLGNKGTITIEYKAKLTAGAVLGGNGNPNKLVLKYFRDPNADQSGNKNPPDETPEVKVVAFTFELDGNKIDGTNQNTKLEGAVFHLARKNSSGDAYEWATIENGKVTSWVSAGEGDPTVKDGENDVPYAGSDVTSDADGKFNFSGLDVDTYYLFETTAPTGYNLLTGHVVVQVSATYKDGPNGTKVVDTLNATVDTKDTWQGDASAGTINGNITNNKGATLPETGGIGTTIFYVVGGLLTVGAVVLLVTKKRMSVDSDK